MAKAFDGETGQIKTKPRLRARISDFLCRRFGALVTTAAILFGVTVLFGITAFAMVIMPDRRGVQKVIVPDMVGKTYTAGQLDENIFRVIIEYEYDESLPAGVVKRQYPLANSERKAVRDQHLCTLRLTLSRGKNTVMLPSLTGASPDEAAQKLRELGFEVQTEYLPDSTLPAGTVISTAPAAFSDVPPGTVVVIKVSGVKTDMPALVGLGESEARRRMELLGIAVGNSEYVASEQPAGIVLEQSVPFGAPVTSGTTVYLTVSRGAG